MSAEREWNNENIDLIWQNIVCIMYTFLWDLWIFMKKWWLCLFIFLKSIEMTSLSMVFFVTFFFLNCKTLEFMPILGQCKHVYRIKKSEHHIDTSIANGVTFELIFDSKRNFRIFLYIDICYTSRNQHINHFPFFRRYSLSRHAVLCNSR